MQIIIIFLIITFFSNLYAKNVTLNAKVSYTNNSSKYIKKIYHRITVPETREYQKIKGIIVQGVDSYKLKLHKKDVSQKYIEFLIHMSPHSSKTINITFDIELSPYTYNLNNATKNIPNLQKYLTSSKRIESSSNKFQNIASEIIQKYPNISDQIIAAYKYPSKVLHYQVQNKTTALTALKTGKGDCTEYAMVFVALCRAMGIPSRVVNLFNFQNKNKTWSQPNHNEAEIYIQNYGWMPIYSNLGLGSLTNKYSPGKVSDTNILFSHGVWTWSNYLPNTKHIKNLIDQKTIWSIK